ncbi:uncharacterized protein LOC122641556 [Telopea speciosissima]|uniref:uncharacterized protein LOC122641556 n=1 Tax=Telopea speciosissima TaxID=54955 RepID=UPI001CC3D4BE|nr:uncharacterized protein LOC122641556 [Telopea speciosissima]
MALALALGYGLPQNLILKKSNALIAFQLKSSLSNQVKLIPVQKRCLRCNTLHQDKDNSPLACSFHGHINGEKGLFSLAPPHQGIDGEWSDRSGVIVYKWNDKGNRPNTGSANWKKRWSCCSEYDENAAPCRRGWHVSYDDGFTLY